MTLSRSVMLHYEEENGGGNVEGHNGNPECRREGGYEYPELHSAFTGLEGHDHTKAGLHVGLCEVHLFPSILSYRHISHHSIYVLCPRTTKMCNCFSESKLL